MANGLRRAVVVVLALTSVATSWQVMAAQEHEPPAEQQAVNAVWKVREFDFFYRSSIAIFSCDALRDRVAAILRGIGARDDLQVRVDDCQNSFMQQESSTDPWNTSGGSNANTWQTQSRLANRSTGREQAAHVRVRLMLPTEVTPQILDELQRDQSRRELISRVTGNPAARQDHPVVFPARRQSVTLSRKTIGLDPVECELLEQMSNALGRLDVRVVRRSFSCDRNSISRIPPQLTVETLMGIPFVAREPQVLPAEEKEADPSEPAAAEPAPPEPANDTKLE